MGPGAGARVTRRAFAARLRVALKSPGGADESVGEESFMIARRADRALLALWLALALPVAASAGELYRWVTPEGRVEIGPFPPRGVHAEPWKPEQTGPSAQPATPAPPTVPAASPASPSGAPGSARAPSDLASPPVGPRPDACELRRREARELARQRQDTESEIGRLEATIGKLEESLVMHEESSCRRDAYGQVSRGCTGGSFDRDTELEKSHEKLEEAQSRLDDLEQRERAVAPGDDCAAVPAAPGR
jgi:hypothetical protein